MKVLALLPLLFATPSFASDISLPVVVQCDDMGKERYGGTLTVIDHFEGECHDTIGSFGIDYVQMKVSISFNGLTYDFTGKDQRIFASFTKKPCNLSNYSDISAFPDEYPIAYEENSTFAVHFQLVKSKTGLVFGGRVGHCAFKTK